MVTTVLSFGHLAAFQSFSGIEQRYSLSCSHCNPTTIFRLSVKETTERRKLLRVSLIRQCNTTPTLFKLLQEPVTRSAATGCKLSFKRKRSYPCDFTDFKNDLIRRYPLS